MMKRLEERESMTGVCVGRSHLGMFSGCIGRRISGLPPRNGVIEARWMMLDYRAKAKSLVIQIRGSAGLL